jgi:protoporphyrinogen oxidase
MSNSKSKAVIIGAGPGGLTAAWELLTRTSITPVCLEKSTYMGGISRTVNYKGNRIDIGGHRFFSKSDRVMSWWLEHLRLEDTQDQELRVKYHNNERDLTPFQQRPPSLPAPQGDEVMLVRPRRSRIYYLRKLFEYPIRLSLETLTHLGAVRSLRIMFSYLRSVVAPIRNVVNLEQFFINRFGRELYRTFFQSYTEKVWGVPCHEISAAWGEQRIKGLSIRKTLAHMVKSAFGRRSGIAQKGTETSLIEKFLYPKYGPGQMWETVARKVEEKGGEIITRFDVKRLHCEGKRITAIAGVDQTGTWREFKGDYFFSTMPIQELIRDMDAAVPAEIREISEGLMYRDFITVGLLLKRLKLADPEKKRRLIEDNWIYIQEPDVSAGRLQIFNNWSPHLVAQADTVWIGVEYFCYESDELWKQSDQQMASFAVQEMAKIGIVDPEDVLDSTVLRMPKTYPAYFGTYERFDELRKFLDGFENLFLIGRNGMHKYNNQDHSMLTAMVAVDNIVVGTTDKSAIWDVNTEMEYHETKDTGGGTQARIEQPQPKPTMAASPSAAD